MTTNSTGPAGPRSCSTRAALDRTLSRIAHELIERNDDLDALALVGIHTRGVPLARRLQALVADRSGVASSSAPSTSPSIATTSSSASGAPPLHAQPIVRGTELDFPLEGKTVVLVDDVLFTGRTIRAAIDALLEYGRPRACSSPSSSTAATASSRSAPTTSARTSPLR